MTIINSNKTIKEYEKLIINHDAEKLAKLLAKDLPASNAKGIITKDKVEQLAKKHKYTPLIEAYKSYKALKNIPGSCLHDREALSLALFIEGGMQKYTSQGKAHLDRSTTGLCRTIEYNRTARRSYIIFKENGAPLIGRGAMKIVYRAAEYNRAKSRLVAYAEGTKNNVESEVKNMNCAKALSCVIQPEHVINFRDAAAKVEKIGIILPFYSSGALSLPLMKSLTIDQKLKLMKDCVTGLQGLHSRNIVHGDLTIWNIFLTKTGNSVAATIGDLGISRIGANVPEHSLYYNLQSREPPERFLGAKNISAKKRDVFSLGGIFYKMLYNQDANWETNEYANSINQFQKAPSKPRPDLYKRYCEKIRSGLHHIEKTQNKNKSKTFAALQNLVRSMLEPDPAKRPDINQIASRLRAIH
jgi:hypothetical protein